MMSKINRYRMMQTMFYPRMSSTSAKNNNLGKSFDVAINSNKSRFDSIVDTRLYSKINKSLQDFQKKLRAVHYGADELLNLTSDIKTPVSKEYGQKLSEKGAVLSEALEELNRTFINPRFKKTGKTVEKMTVAFEKGKEYWEKIGISFNKKGKFSLDLEKFSNVANNDPKSVIDGISKLKGMAGEVKKSTNISKKDQYKEAMAWYMKTKPDRFNVNNYTVSGTNLNYSFSDSKGSVIDGFI